MSKNKDEIKEKDPRFRKLTIVKNLSTNVVDYNINGFGNPIDVDTLWGFIDNECNPNLIKQRIVNASKQQQIQSQNKPVEEKEDAKKG